MTSRPNRRSRAAKLGLGAGSLALLVGLGGSGLSPASAQQGAAPAVANSGTAEERGAYLARAADCMSCHNEPGKEDYAGGLGMPTPFGTIYSSNITPDPDTGIGGWTEADFGRALREGVRKDGAYIYPAMPYNSYTKMTDQDVSDLWSYVQTIPPVRKEVPENKLGFPFNIRSGLAVWQQLFLEEGRFQPVTGKDETWNRGAYLVEALGHCSGCHSPRNFMGATQEDKELTGARIEAWYAPNIGNNSLSGIKDWSVEKLTDYLKGRQTAETGVAAGPMAQVVHTSLSHLTDEDVRAMAIYLKDAPPPEELPERVQAATAASAPDRRVAGESIYNGYCRSCHQANGEGIDRIAPRLAGDTSVSAREPFNAVTAVLQGFKANDQWGPMPSFATALSDQAVADVVNYIRTSWGNQAEANATPWQVGTWRQVADAAAYGSTQAPQLSCPKLVYRTLDGPTAETLGAIERGEGSREKFAELVSRFRAANPQSSRGDTVNALLSGYCTNVAAKDIPYSEKGSQLASFMGGLAQVVAGQP